MCAHMFNEAKRASSACHHHRRHPVETCRPRWLCTTHNSNTTFILRSFNLPGNRTPRDYATRAILCRLISRLIGVLLRTHRMGGSVSAGGGGGPCPAFVQFLPRP